jgi:hypothetical protein
MDKTNRDIRNRALTAAFAVGFQGTVMFGASFQHCLGLVAEFAEQSMKKHCNDERCPRHTETFLGTTVERSQRFEQIHRNAFRHNSG